jgi:hypothetical protein
VAVNCIAALWAFAEATLFFIVPDVWLSLAGRENLRRGLMACLNALVGALVRLSEQRQSNTHSNRRPEINPRLDLSQITPRDY